MTSGKSPNVKAQGIRTSEMDGKSWSPNGCLIQRWVMSKQKSSFSRMEDNLDETSDIPRLNESDKATN